MPTAQSTMLWTCLPCCLAATTVRVLDNLMQNPSLNDLVGGITSVTLGDDAAKARGNKKTVSRRMREV